MLKGIFTRQTSSGKVLKEIDGLRSVAILMVVYFHMFGNLSYHLNSLQNYIPYWLVNILHNGDNGVPLFFAISAFILGLPFARHYLFNSKPVQLKKYFIRRITRLQPSYFIILLLFGGYYFFNEKYELSTLVKSFLLSNVYLHNIALESGSYINYVAWSLEVEFQFYLLLPLLATIFKLPAIQRRLLLITGILLGSSAFNYISHSLPFISLLNYFHYFFAGLLCLDLYLTMPQLLKHKNKWLIPAGIGALLILISQSPHQLLGAYILPFSASFILLLTLQNSFWNKLFSIPFLSHTGTMSYTMYLIHFQIIAIFGGLIIKVHNINESTLILFAGIIILLSIIWIASAIAFAIIEKPFMNPNWYKLKK